jgi:uncharacterized protein YkwD
MTLRSVRARLALAWTVSLSLTFLLALPAAAATVPGGVPSAGSTAARARSTTDPSISDPPVLVAASDPGPTDVELGAEARAVALIEDARASAHLPPLRSDPDLAAIARQRADDMRDRGYFGHTSPDGHTVFEMLDAASVAWASGAEVIGWNDLPTPDGSAARVVADWLASPTHRGDLLSPDADRIGLASAYDPATRRRTWAAVLVASADRTPPLAWVRIVAIGRREASGRRAVTVAWSTRDDPGRGIATGVRDVTVQVRTGAGPWRTTMHGGAVSSLRLHVPADRVVAVRVRPRDRAGNLGSWSSVTIRP